MGMGCIGSVFANRPKGTFSPIRYEGGRMRDFSRRTRILLGGTVAGVLATGLAGAMVIPASAHESSAPKAEAATSTILSVCVTVREVHLGPVCVKI